MTTSRSASDAGVTLVELLVALAVFALVATAGFALVNSLLRVREGVDGRLERLADFERALHLLAADFEQAASGPLVVDGQAVAFRRADPRGAFVVRYDLDGTNLVRTVGLDATARSQTVLGGVAGMSWRFYTPDGGWAALPPPSVDGVARRPSAVQVELRVDRGALRRVIMLPELP